MGVKEPKTDLNLSDIEAITEAIEIFEKKHATQYGLHNGKTGIALAYFMLADFLDNNLFLKKAKAFIEEIGDNIEFVKEIEFENGLTGIGWAIEWMVQNKLIDANTDDILEEMDDILYKSVIFTKSPCAAISNEFTGKAYYFFRRLIARNPGTKRYRKLCNQECLFLLINEICEKQVDAIKVLNLRSDFREIKIMLQIFTLLTKATPRNLYTTTGTKLICTLAELIQAYFLTDDFKKEDHTLLSLHSIYACAVAGKYLNDNRFTSSALVAYKSVALNMKFIKQDNAQSVFLLNKIAIELNLPFESKVFGLHPAPEASSIFDILVKISLLNKSFPYDWEEGWFL